MAATYHAPGVYVEEVDRGSKPIEGVGTAVAAFVGFTERAPDPSTDPADPDGVRPRLVTNWAQYQRLYGGFAPGAMLPHAVYGYFNNGGGSCYVVRIGRDGGHGSGNGDGGAARSLAVAPGQSGASASVSLPAGTRPELETLSVEALSGAVVDIEIEVERTGNGDEPPATFNLKVREGGKDVESHAELSFSKGSQFVETVVNKSSSRIRVQAPPAQGVSAADRIPAPGTYALAPPVPAAPTRPAGAVSSDDFAGDEADRTGINGLVIAENVTMLAVPDLVTAAVRNGKVDLDLVKAVHTTLIDFGERTQTMAILDAPPSMSPQHLGEWRRDVAMYDSRYATMYYPWLEVADPVSTGQLRTVLVPPSGHVAGIWARNDATRGVWKAPANEVVRGIMNVETKVTRGEQELLNPLGINVIRPFGTRGVRIWGARTLSSDPSWRYVNVRRLFNYIEQSIEQGTQWVVFEPNDLDLWQRVKRTISAFLMGLWRQGALVGATPEQAFFVKCDGENNPVESVDEGRLVVDVGIAPVKPAEFVIFRISQWQGGAASGGEGQ
jgi:phage tail sheath protein FI